jgi:phospholipase C
MRSMMAAGIALLALVLDAPRGFAATQAPTATNLTSSQNPAVYGQAETFTATVTASAGTPGGKVTFKKGTTSLGSVALVGGVATLTTTLGLGSWSVTAVYGGGPNFASSTSAALNQVVNPAVSTVTISSSQNPSTVGQPLTVTATVTSSGGGTAHGTVVFSSGTTKFGTFTLVNGAASTVVTPQSVGSLALKAAFNGGKDFGKATATFNQSVLPGGAISYALNASALSPVVVSSGGAATSTVTVTPAQGYTGNVNLSCSSISGSPPGISCSFNPASVTISNSNPGTSTLTVSTSTAVPAANYTVSVTGADANDASPSNGTQALTFTTVAAGAVGYALSATSFTPASVTAGNAAWSVVSVIPINGYTGNVALTCSSSAGACLLNPSSVAIDGANSGNSTLTVSTPSSPPTAKYNVSVTGNDANQLAPSNGSQSLTLNAVSLIQHIVIIVQENRTPDNLFQDPVLIQRGADIASSGINSLGQTIPLTPINLGTSGPNPDLFDLGHAHNAFLAEYDNGKMDGADLVPCNPRTACQPFPHPQFMYVYPSDVQPYFAMAEQYTFADRMFQTNQGPSFPAHQFLLSGTSAPTATSPLFASGNPPIPAGCIAPAGSTVFMIDASGSETNQAPQYPCFEHPTLSDLLDSANISWRYYAWTAGSYLTGPNGIEHICQPQTVNGTLTCTGYPWANNVNLTGTQVLVDIANGQLPQVSWVVPTAKSSDHAIANDGSGPSWVASVVNAIGNSPYWANTAIFITWDDWGGWYDHVAPQTINDGVSWGSGYVYGLRVPLIVVSPYAKAGYISHVTHDFGSILKFVERTFSLPSLGYADAPADDLSDCFDFGQSPIVFQTIGAPLDAKFFLNDKTPPAEPDDD